MYVCIYVYMLYIVCIIYICIYTPSNLLVDKIYLIVVAVISKLVYFMRAVTGK